MASSLSLRQRGNRGGPQIDPLREQGDLRTATSPQSIHTYTEKRSDFVERPPHLISVAQRLTQALAGLHPPLMQYIAHGRQEFEDKQYAIGQELLLKNLKEWNEFIKENPQYAGLNPHLERGYKAADLIRRAQGFHAAAQNFYTTSGLVNETDPEKVREALHNFTMQWVDENIPSGMFDPTLLSENFYNHVQTSEGTLMERHTQDRASEHLRLSEENLGQLCSSTIESGLMNTPGISHPDVFEQSSSGWGKELTGHIETMVASGMPRSLANKAATSAIINLAKAEGPYGFGEEILTIARHVQSSTGGPLSKSPEFKAEVQRLKDGWKQDKRNDWHFAKALENEDWNKKRRNNHLSINRFLYDKDMKGEEVTEQELKMLVGPDGYDIAVDRFGEHLKHKQNPLAWTPDRIMRMERDRMDIQLGRMPDDRAFMLPYIYGHEGMKLLAQWEDKQGGKDPLAKMLSDPIIQNDFDMIEIDIRDTFKDRPEEYKQKRILEARREWYDTIVMANENKPLTKQGLHALSRKTSRDIRNNAAFRATGLEGANTRLPEEVKGMSTSSNFWQTNQTPYFKNKETTQATLIAWLENPAAVETQLKKELGVSAPMVKEVIMNQCRLYGIPFGHVTKEHFKTKEKEIQQQEAKDRVVKFYGGHPHTEGEGGLSPWHSK